MALGEHVTKETKGANLADVQDDRKSLAATEQFKGGDDDSFKDMKNQAANYDKYSEGNIVKEPSEAEDDEQLGFMDEEIQPKQSTAIFKQNLPQILSSWNLVEKIGLERFGVVFMKNFLKLSPESMEMFKFKDIPDLYKHEIFKSHSLQVMQNIDKTIQNIDDLEHMKDTSIPKCEIKNYDRGVTS